MAITAFARCAFSTLALSAALITPVVAQDAIRIGSFVSATGPAAFLGDPQDKTLHLYVEQLNASGGVLGRPVELILYDDGGDANRARTFATRLVEDDRVIAVVGGTATGPTLAAMPVFEEAEIPFISFAGAIEIVQPTRTWTFKTPHNDRTACERIFEDMQERGIAKIGLISGTDGFGQSMRNQCIDVVSNYGIEILADESYGASDSDMTPQLAKIRNTAGIEAIVNPGFGQGPAIVTRNYAQLGIDLPFYQSHGVASQSFIDLAGAAAEGIRLPAPALLLADTLDENDPQREIALAYKTSYEDATGEQVSTFGGYSFDGIQLLVAAIERAGSTDPTAIRDALEATSGYVGVTGIYTMGPDDHLGLGTDSFRMVEIRDGGWVSAE